VGRRAKSDNRVGLLNATPRQVRVDIHADNERHRRPDRGADGGQKRAVGVIVGLGHHCPVQGEEDPIERRRRFQPAEQVGEQPLVRLGRHRTA
jgi:hypothetical protein